MKKEKLIIVGLALISLATLVAPSIASAYNAGVKSNVFNLDTLRGPLLICSGSNTAGGLPMCNDLCDLVAQIANIIYFMIAVIIWIVAPALVAASGIMFMIAGPNPDMIGRARKTLTGVVWGLAITLCAWLLVFTFVHAIGNLSQFVGGFGGPDGKAACSL